MIEGNVTAVIQIDAGHETNEIGAPVEEWQDADTITGWLDVSEGDSKHTFNAKMQESTHIFIADYKALDKRIRPESSRVLIDGMVYDVMLIDDPMGLHEHLEIYLKYTGGQ